jgi:hypothetical protein
MRLRMCIVYLGYSSRESGVNLKDGSDVTLSQLSSYATSRDSAESHYHALYTTILYALPVIYIAYLQPR